MSLFYEHSKPLPEELYTSEFLARPLRSGDVNIDFEAYKASPKTIKTHSMGLWETDNFSLQENLELLKQHEQRHLGREDFAFLLMSPKKTISLGCVYLLPLLRHHQKAAAYGFDAQTAMVTFWTRDSVEEPTFSIKLVASLKQWLQDSWDFSNYVFRINTDELESKQALEQNTFSLRFKLDRDNSPLV